VVTKASHVDAGVLKFIFCFRVQVEGFDGFFLQTVMVLLWAYLHIV